MATSRWTRESVDQTHENSGKAFVDYKPWSWLLARASWSVSDRHYDTYDYRGFYANAQWSDAACITPGSCNVQYNTAFRQFYLTIASGRLASFRLRSMLCAA